MKSPKKLKTILASGMVALAAWAAHGGAQAQNAYGCAWPLTVSPSGSGNWLAPDDHARYWIMPFPGSYKSMRIQGSYPNARFFSFTAYSGDASGRPAETAGNLYDASIVPDSGAAAGRTAGSYTVQISRDPAVSGRTNGIAVTANDAWVILRMYLPAPDPSQSGQALSGSVPLPAITLDDGTPLPPCPPASPLDGNSHHPVRSVNKLEDMRAFLQLLFPPGFDLRQPTDFDQVVTGRLWFAPPRVPPILLFPNPYNKYLLNTPGPYQRGRIIVMRGKAPTTPTAPGRSEHRPRHGASDATDLRYWSVCNNDFALPVSAVRCVGDSSVTLEGGYYTVVITDDLVRPDWLRPGVNWLPWGDEQYPKLIFFRHLLPSAGFTQAVQQVVKGCPASCANPNAVFDFTLPDLPPRASINAAGPVVQQLMGEYCPVAAWCDKSTFERGAGRPVKDGLEGGARQTHNSA